MEIIALYGSPVFLFVALLSYYWILVAQRPKVYVRNGRMKKFIDERLPILRERYCPSLFWEGNMQSALGIIQRARIYTQFKFKLEVYTLRDGGQLGLEILEPNTTAIGRKNVVVLILPGAGGCKDETYMQTLIRAIQGAGAKTIVFNNRGFAGVSLKTPKTHSSRDTEDVREVATYLKKVYHDSIIIGVGVSLGAVLFCHYLMDHPKEADDVFTSALLISPVWNYYNTMLHMETTIKQRFLNKYIANNLLNKFLTEKEMMQTKQGCFDWEAIESCKSIRDFERTVNLPQLGYASLHDYWTDVNLTGKINRLPIPVFAINAHDDPMIPQNVDLPLDEAIAEDSNLALIVTARGGHVGFLEGISLWPKDTHYMERVTSEFIRGFTDHRGNIL